MKLLLDTHTVIWAFSDDPTLSHEARAAITDGKNPVFVSAVSAWEMVIKAALGKLRVPLDYLEQVDRHSFMHLDVTAEHALAVRDLPMIHHDPFDRLLVAQASVEGLTVVTRDKNIARYVVPVLVA